MTEPDTGGSRIVESSILDAIRGRIANMNVVSVLASDTDCYSKNTPGDGYAKNVCSVDLRGTERVLPPFTEQVFNPPRQ
jgi:hypothetical protein